MSRRSALKVIFPKDAPAEDVANAKVLVQATVDQFGARVVDSEFIVQLPEKT